MDRNTLEYYSPASIVRIAAVAIIVITLLLMAMVTFKLVVNQL